MHVTRSEPRLDELHVLVTCQPDRGLLPPAKDHDLSSGFDLRR